MHQKAKIIAFLLTLFMLASMAHAVTNFNFTAPTGTNEFSHRGIGIDLNVGVEDLNALLNNASVQFDINISTSNTQGTGQVILNDANFLLANGLTCDSNFVVSSTACHFTITTQKIQDLGLGTGTYFVIAEINDNNDAVAGTDTNFSASPNFQLTVLSKADALCASVSGDLAVANGCIDDDDLEDTATSTASIGILEGGDSAGLIVLGALIIFLIAVVTIMGATMYSKINSARKKI